MESRRHRRYPVTLPAAFLGNTASGGGSIVNVSAGGCCIEAGTLPAPGQDLKLYIVTPVSQVTLVIDGASVRWVQARYFGVEFVKVQSASEEILRQWLGKLAAESQ